MDILACPVCGNRDVTVLHDLENIPANQNVVYKQQKEAIFAKCANIKLIFCRKCGFVYNGLFEVSNVSYDCQYNNDQSASEMFRSYVNRQIDWLLTYHISKDSNICEIGCGSGYYIKRIAEKSNGNKYGFDTSYIGETYFENLKLRYYKEYFSSKYKYLNIDFFICRHVIEHIEKPLEFFKKIRESIKENALLFLETPDFDWIVENKAIYDINYEHCSYFNHISFKNMLNLAGFEIVEYISEFGGQYMWFVIKPSKNSMEFYDDIPIVKYKSFCDGITSRKDKYLAAVSKLKMQGRVIAIWGAGAKGSMILNLVDKDQKIIDYVVDINSGKQGKYIGGTGHPIIAPKYVNERAIDCIIIMNPNYRDEISLVLQELNANPELLTL